MTDLPTVVVDGSPVHVLDEGDGPAVLLLHGSGPGTTGSGAWGATAEALGGSWRLVAPDQAGFGRTPLPPGSRGGLRLWTEQAAGLMDALDVESYDVVGHSMGGAVALALAALRPHQVNHVVAVSTMGAPGAPLSAELDAVWAAPAGRRGRETCSGVSFSTRRSVTETAVASRATAMEAGACAFASMFPPPRARWAEDLTLSAQTLEEIRAPSAAGPRRRGPRHPVEVGGAPLLEHLADVRLHVFGRCGHVPAVEHPHDFRRLLSDFLRRP